MIRPCQVLIDRAIGQEPPSRHRAFLRWIPLHSSSKALITQRKVALYGIRVRETPEDINEREIRRQIRILLPEVFDGMSGSFCTENIF